MRPDDATDRTRFEPPSAYPARAHPARAALGWLGLLAALGLAGAGLRWAGRAEASTGAAAAGAPAGTDGRWAADPTAALLAAATLVGWAVLAWLAVSLALTALAGLPGRSGRLAGRLADAVSPALLRRLAAAALGVSLVGSPTLAGATVADPDVGAFSVSVSALDRPAQPSATAGDGGVLRAAPPVPAAGVRVRPGDSLWAIAARSLGPRAGPGEVAAEWPRWFAANREVIGPDPDLLQPGQWLAAP